MNDRMSEENFLGPQLTVQRGTGVPVLTLVHYIEKVWTENNFKSKMSNMLIC